MDRALDLKPEAQCRLPYAPGVCALGWVKCREHISFLIILCIIVYVTNKAHLSLICIVCFHSWWFENSIIFHIIYIITISFSPGWHKRLNKFRQSLMKTCLPKNEMCCDSLAFPVRCDWRTA